MLHQRGQLERHEAITITLQLLDGLAAVHTHGIIHRDVKPGNILIDLAGRAILTDFGLARPEEAASVLTSGGGVMGTPAYMAPEQAAGKVDQIGPWTDLYAVGVVLYQMLTGRLPFEGAAAAVLGAVLRDEPPSPRQHRPDLDPALEAVVLRALRKDLRNRFVAAGDFRAALGVPASLVPARTEPSSTLLLQPSAAPGQPWASTRWLLRRLPWLLGSIPVALSGALVAWIVLYSITETSVSLVGRLLPPSLVTLLPGSGLMVVGLLLWALVEMSWTPQGLRWAAKQGWWWCVRSGASQGVPLDVPDEVGETALMHAAAGGHTEVVKVLLLHGVDSRAVSSLGQTAVEIAYARGHGAIVALLQKESRPPRPPTSAPARQPAARGWLVGSALLGAMVVVWYNWVSEPWPTRISYEEVRQLVLDRKVKSIEIQRSMTQTEAPSGSARCSESCMIPTAIRT
jgi:hypothetical protein